MGKTLRVLEVKGNTILLSPKEYKNLFEDNKKEEDGIGIIASEKARFTDFTMIKNNLFIDKSVYPSTRFLYMFLLSLAFMKGHCFASYDFLADRLGWTRKTIWQHLQDLEEKGWIVSQRKGRGKPNVYTLNR